LVRNVVYPYLRALKSSNVDSIDCFTNELVEKRNFQWKNNVERYLQDEEKYSRVNQKTPVEMARSHSRNHLENNVRKMDECQMRNHIELAIEEQHPATIQALLDESLDLGISLSGESVKDILEFAARAGNRDIIEKMRYFCAKTQPELLLKAQRFILYEIRIIWKEGNTERAMKKLRKTYPSIMAWNPVEVHRILRIFSRETVGQKSEGVLLNFIKLAEFISTDFDDHFALEIIWRDCFFSRWFSDQEVAVKLFCQQPPIQKFVEQQSKLIAFKLLIKHRTETVYRLIELLLDAQVNMKATCREVLMVLFDYQYWRNNSTGCSEIIQSSDELGIPLGPEYEKKLVILLLKPRPIVTTKKQPAPTVEYKF
uniref:Uncharacterized protein n=1 Tax=Lutzomyia longipalpis TaxID=7200 RepID=A0A1B0CBW3_LUTLO